MSAENGKIIGLVPRPEPKGPGLATQIVRQAIESAPQAVAFVWNEKDRNVRSSITQAAKRLGVMVSVKRDGDGQYRAFVK